METKRLIPLGVGMFMISFSMIGSIYNLLGSWMGIILILFSLKDAKEVKAE